jgi:hypothetical protein
MANRNCYRIGTRFAAIRASKKSLLRSCRKKQFPDNTGFLWAAQSLASHFPHNLALVSVLYSGERPEMTSHGGKSKKAKTTKGS